MDYKPADFFVGLVDFFAILLPGALLAFVFKDVAAKHVFGVALPRIGNQVEGWVAFTFAAYLLGQFVSLVGATFMDRIYDVTYLAYKRRAGDPRYDKAKELEGEYSRLAGVLKWAGAYVRLCNADAALEIDRFEATSKFFRSLVVVLLVYAAVFTANSQLIALVTSLGLLLLSFWRFCNQRWKFTEFSYLYFIELKVCAEMSPRPSHVEVASAR